MNRRLNLAELAALMESSAGLNVSAAELESQPELSFADFGLDSLGLLGIIAELENRYGMQLGDDAEGCKSPHELVDLVNAQLTSGG